MTQGSPAPNFRQDEFNRFLNTWADDSMHIVLKGHLFIERELYTLLATCAHNTRRITLGPGVTTLVTRHPTTTAAALAALAEIAPGRVGARFGFGGTSTHGIGLRSARLEEYRTGFELVAQLLQGETAQVNGQDVKLVWADPSLTQQITLYPQIGSGPRSQRLAGELGHPVTCQELGMQI